MLKTQQVNLNYAESFTDSTLKYGNEIRNWYRQIYVIANIKNL